ncbi:MAG TPA: hypothetical protein VJ890_07500 [Vineibacter sp.]|nr:hypothetical protein [Vineibacter sp.]
MPSLSSIDQDIVWLVFAAALLLAGFLLGFVLGSPGRNRDRATQAELDAARFELETLRTNTEVTQSDIAAAQAAAARVSVLEDKLVAAGRQAADGARVPGLEKELAALRDQVVALTSENTRLAEAQRAADEARSDSVATLTALRDDVESRIAAAVEAALHRHQQGLVETAQRLWEDQHRLTDANLKAHHGAIDGLVRPLADSLENYQQRLTVLEQEKATPAAAARAPRRERSRASQRAAGQEAQPVDGAAHSNGDLNGGQEPVALVAAGPLRVAG